MVATRRRVTRGKSEKYEIGDRVEVFRVQGMEIGILLSKDDADDRSGDTAHWVVSVNGSSEEEVISERMLGQVLEDIDQTSDSSTFDKTQKEAPVKKATKTKVKTGPKKKKGGIRRLNTRAGATKNGEMPTFEDGDEIVRRPAPRPRKKDGDETVIEVKMLTGTLFIYRGEHHRVEFIRTV